MEEIEIPKSMLEEIFERADRFLDLMERYVLAAECAAYEIPVEVLKDPDEEEDEDDEDEKPLPEELS
jgi:hypothetical protein